MRWLASIFFLMITGLMLWGIGCGPQYWTYRQGKVPEHLVVQVIPVWMDNSLLIPQREGVIEAVGEWNKVFNGQIILQMEPVLNRVEALKKLDEIDKTRTGWVIISSTEEMLIAEGYIDEGDGVLAYVYNLGGNLMIIVRDRIGTRDFKVIAMHEMGHLLGADHINAMSLMAPHYGREQINCIDKVTVAQVARFNRLRFETLNYCLTPEFE
jgi:predicted Zn-dependent protease